MPTKKNANWISWRSCKARAVILAALEKGEIPLDANEMSPEEAFEIFKDKPGFENVVFSQFKERLAGHRQQVKNKAKKSDWIMWRGSKARALLLEAVVKGEIPVDHNEMSAEQAFNLFKDKPEFEGVVFSQFKERLSDHRHQVKNGRKRSAEEEKCLAHDRTLFPRKLVNSRGELVFDLHPAKMILREMVEEGVNRRKTPREMWLSRPEFQAFKLKIFGKRIRQEVRRKKYCNMVDKKREGGWYEI